MNCKCWVTNIFFWHKKNKNHKILVFKNLKTLKIDENAYNISLLMVKYNTLRIIKQLSKINLSLKRCNHVK